MKLTFNVSYNLRLSVKYDNKAYWNYISLSKAISMCFQSNWIKVVRKIPQTKYQINMPKFNSLLLLFTDYP